MRITLIQTGLYWEDKAANLRQFTSLIDGIAGPTDLVVLPEMFTTGFSMQATQLAEDVSGPVIAWMQEMAAKKDTAICGSLMMRDGEQHVNRFVWMNPDGTMHTYDKRHLFRMAEEHRYYTGGTSRIIIPYKGWKIFPVVCYDLRFPVWLRRTKQFDYDMLVVVANWPERRSMHWETLLQARAIENQCYVAAVNRVGDDGNGFHYSGSSGVISPKGEIIFRGRDEAFVKTFEPSLQELQAWRNDFPVIEDADPFTLE